MPHITRSSRRYLRLLFVAILAAALLHYFFFLTRIPNLGSSLYLLILLVWLVSAGRRLLLPRIRRLYMLGAALLMLLFIIRVIRYQTGPSPLNRYCWYAYYLSFSALPLCFLSSAYLIGREEKSRFPFWLTGVWIGWGCLSMLALTNDLHGLLFEIEGLRAGAYQYSYGPLYYVIVAWIAAGMLTGFALLLRRCRLRQCRALWYVPVLAAVPGVSLLAWFYLNGGSSPLLFGHGLYNVQEAYMILFLFVWESCIQIGLVPSNTDYDTIFALLPLDAFITSEAGQVLLRSADAAIPAPELLDAARLTPQALDADHVLHSHPIRGGAVYWSKNIAAVNSVNQRIADAIEYLEGEETLLHEEARIKAERASFEMQNRFYDSIMPLVQPQLAAAGRLLADENVDDLTFRGRLTLSMIYGAYAKRRVNLALLAQGEKTLHVEELELALEETLEYLRLRDIACAMRRIGDARELPAEYILLLYDFFSAAVEAALPSLSALYVLLRTDAHLGIDLSMESHAALLEEHWRNMQLGSMGAVMTVQEEDDGTGHARLRFSEVRE